MHEQLTVSATDGFSASGEPPEMVFQPLLRSSMTDYGDLRPLLPKNSRLKTRVIQINNTSDAARYVFIEGSSHHSVYTAEQLLRSKCNM